jgi:hypothetical protein
MWQVFDKEGVEQKNNKPEIKIEKYMKNLGTKFSVSINDKEEVYTFNQKGELEGIQIFECN